MFGLTFPPARPRSAGPHAPRASARASPPRRRSRTRRWFAARAARAGVPGTGPATRPSQREAWQPGKPWHGASVMVGMKNHAAAALLRARRSARLRGRADEADDQGDQVPPALYQRGQRPVVAAADGEVATHHAALGPGITGGGPATGPARTGQHDEHDDREVADGPIVEKIVAGRVRQGVLASLVALAPALPLTAVFARVLAAVFETPFLRHRSWPQDGGQQHPRAEGAPG
jgi:hypothetical protein